MAPEFDNLEMAETLDNPYGSNGRTAPALMNLS
jgi:hypothetical protein